MSGFGDAAEAVLALAIGGFLFITIGSALASTSSGTPLVNFQFWGVLYVMAAVVLAIGTVYAFARSVLA